MSRDSTAQAHGGDRGARAGGLLGDTAARDYSRKLALFNAFAERELRTAIAMLALRPGMRVLDAGCGTGEALQWLGEAVGARQAASVDSGWVVGIELASAHASQARARCSSAIDVLQADLARVPLRPSSFDLVWSVNTIHHLRDPPAAVRTLASLVRPGGRIALGQSSLLPDMYFAWDSRLERIVNEAVRRYYRERYGISERDVADLRSLVGLLLAAGLANVAARTSMIERTQPLAPADEAYLLEVIFRGTWGERLGPYLADPERAELERLCDPRGSAYALRRADFHFLQTFTLVVGEVPASGASSGEPAARPS